MGFLSGLFDDGSKAANKFNKEQLAYIKSLYGSPSSSNPNTLFGQLAQSYGQGLPYMQEAVNTQKGALQSARGALSASGAEAYRAISDMRKQGTSAARQRNIQSGLYNTSAGISMENQAGYQSQRAAGQLGSQLAQQMSGLEMAGGAATANALANVANYFASRGQGMASLGSQLAGQMGQYQAVPGKSLFSQFASPLGFFLGAKFGGGGGGETPIPDGPA